jgi:PEP-CTERM motif
MRSFSSIACAVSLLAGAGVASATSINVAILSAIGNTSFENDIISKIAPNAPFLNITVLNVHTSTPDLATLNGYQALMVIGNDTFQDGAALGTNLQQYMDLYGRGLVVAAASNLNQTGCLYQLCGTFQTGDYWAIEPGAVKLSAATLGHIYLPGNPLLTGVTTFDGGSYSERIIGNVNGSTGTSRVADWSDGLPLLVTRTFASGATEVGLNFYPVSGDKFAGLWISSTDGGKILANALTLAAGGAGSPDSDIPEPATYLFTGAGLGLMAVLLKRRQRTLQCESEQRPRHR